LRSSLWRGVQRWRGLWLIASLSAVTLWLAWSGQLVLYIHPRYIVFTVIMSSIALVLSLAALASPRQHDDEHEALPPRRDRMLGLAAAAIAAVVVLTTIVIPPATLSAATAEQRDINSSAGDDPAALEAASSADASTVARFTVREWASILRQTSDLAFFADKPASDVVGFITPDAESDDLFYLSRFAVTCCAVDAQPLGVPVLLPGWAEQFDEGSWLSVSGEFISNPVATSTLPVVLEPSTVEQVEQPSEPYLF